MLQRIEKKIQNLDYNYLLMFKEKIKEIKKATDIISLKDIKNITKENNITTKSNYTK